MTAAEDAGDLGGVGVLVTGSVTTAALIGVMDTLLTKPGGYTHNDIFPPGIWHALKNESGISSGYLNVIDELYDYVTPDNYRAASDDLNFPNL